MSFLNSIQLLHPWVLVLLPLPFLVVYFARPWHNERVALFVPFFKRLLQVSGQRRAITVLSNWQKVLSLLCLSLIWIALLLALARPQWIGAPIVEEKPARDMLLAIDLSGSMDAKDMIDASGKPESRLDAVKTVVGDFLKERKGDRVGLIFFGQAPFVQAPFTDDLDVCRQLLAEAQVGMAGQKTMLGDAIGLAIQVFSKSELKDKVLILLTDGNDTGSLVPPAKSAELAKNAGIVIHTIAMGNPATVGEDQFDEKTLRGISAETHGQFFMASDRQALENVYSELNKITPRKVDSVTHRPVSELYQWPLLFAVALSWLMQAVAWIHAAFFNVHATVKSIVVLCVLLALACVLTFSRFEDGFHFLRPKAFILLFPAIILLWLIMQREDSASRFSRVMDPDLLDTMLLSGKRQQRIRPIYVVGVIWILGVFSLSGPTWKQVSGQQADDEAALVIAVKITASMKANDIQPSRLERAKQKISDLLALRGHTRHALIAYAGSAHLVMPFSYDATVINTFNAALQPDLMPVEGDAPDLALALAQKQLQDANATGSILFLADDFPDGFNAVLEKDMQSNGAPVSVLAMLSNNPSFPENKVSLNELEHAASTGKGVFENVTVDKSDVEHIAHIVSNTAYHTGKDAGLWQDEGFLVLPVLVAVSLLTFRRRFVVISE